MTPLCYLTATLGSIGETGGDDAGQELLGLPATGQTSVTTKAHVFPEPLRTLTGLKIGEMDMSKSFRQTCETSWKGAGQAHGARQERLMGPGHQIWSTLNPNKICDSHGRGSLVDLSLTQTHRAEKGTWTARRRSSHAKTDA